MQVLMGYPVCNFTGSCFDSGSIAHVYVTLEISLLHFSIDPYI